MLNIILGWFLIITGVLFLLKPEGLRKKLQKKSIKYLRKILFLIGIALAGFFVAAGWKSEGLFSKILMVIGIIGILKAFFFLKAKAAGKIVEWFLKQPVVFFRVGATLQIILGIIILALRK